MPERIGKIAHSLGIEINTQSYNMLIKDKSLLNDTLISKVDPLFPRIEELLLATPNVIIEEKPKAKEPVKDEMPLSEDGLIGIEQFMNVTLKVATVVEAEEVPKSSKLLKLQVDCGEESLRQIVAGIKEYYSPSDLVGTQVCIVANLKPAKLMGMLSQGMILAAKDENGLALIRPEKPKTTGTQIK
jgi:methionyl-tRNA synthetase